MKEKVTGKYTPSREALAELRDHLLYLDDMLPTPYPTSESKVAEPDGPTDTTVLVKVQLVESEEASAEEKLQDEDDEFQDNYPDEEFPGKHSIEAEELETVVDGILSEMSAHLEDNEEPKSLEELFETFFGEKSKSVSAAADFDDAINGYLGHVFGKDLTAARESLTYLIGFVNRRMANWKA